MNHDLHQLAKKFIEGEWLYDNNEKVLKKVFASDDELKKLNLIDEHGYLHSSLKEAIVNVLNEIDIEHSTGPFGDNDIFSGDIIDDCTLYNIELHHVSENTISLMKTIPYITLK